MDIPGTARMRDIQNIHIAGVGILIGRLSAVEAEWAAAPPAKLSAFCETSGTISVLD